MRSNRSDEAVAGLRRRADDHRIDAELIGDARNDLHRAAAALNEARFDTDPAGIGPDQFADLLGDAVRGLLHRPGQTRVEPGQRARRADEQADDARVLAAGQAGRVRAGTHRRL